MLLVGDDEAYAGGVLRALHRMGLRSTARASAHAGCRGAFEAQDIVLLDFGPANGSAIDICRRIRGEGFSGGLIVLGPTASKQRAATILDAGADDYVSRRFHPDELLARIRAVCRRTRAAALPPTIRSSPPPAVHAFGVIQIDASRQGAILRGRFRSLPRLPYELLVALVTRQGAPMSRRQINDEIQRGKRSDSAARKLVQHLRDRLGADSCLIVGTNKGWHLLPG